MLKVKLYRGFSPRGYEKNKTFSMYDVELIKRDIMNHIFTRKGERVMLTHYGTRIPDLLFEPIDQSAIDIITQDLTTVVQYEPRVTLRDMRVIPLYDDNAIVASLDLNYIELNFHDVLDVRLDFER